MSKQVLRRRTPIGAGLEASLAALRNPQSSPLNLEAPPNTPEAQLEAGDVFTFDSFTVADAQELGHFLQARLASEPRPTLISISLANGLVVFQAAARSGVIPDYEMWIQRKRRSVMRWGSSSWLLYCKFGGDHEPFAAKYGMGKEQASAYTVAGGAIPIYIKGVEGPVAVVIVSGMKPWEDHSVIVDVVKQNWEPVA